MRPGGFLGCFPGAPMAARCMMWFSLFSNIKPAAPPPNLELLKTSIESS